MVRSLVAAGVVTICAMVGLAAMPSLVSSRTGKRPATVPGRGAAAPTAVAPPSPSASPTSARGATTLAGDVSMPGIGAIAGAVVDASHQASGWRALVLTDASGRFRIDHVPLGTVEIVVRRGSLEFSSTVQVTAGMARVTVSPADQEWGQLAGVVGSAPGRAQTNRPTMPVAASPMVPPPVAAAETVMAGPPAQAAPMAMRSFPTLPPTSMDAYARVDPSGYRRVADAPLSTFSVDVDTASYTNARRFLMSGELPPVDAVRIEEWINYFPYAYGAPDGNHAFRVSTALTACPWNPAHQLLRVGVRGRSLARDDARPRNLVFLVDVSGSMMSPDRLPLVRTALRLLADQLTARDRLALVVYAGSSGLVLPSTPGDQKTRIHEALQRLEAGGSTNGAQGIELAYRTAREGFIDGGVNRVVLATDGDFNVGVTSLGELTRLIEAQRASGVFLSVLGVGRGNLKDATLEQLADRGNGNYAYIDSLQEARRVLVEQVGATLVTIAKDVKLQVEFNPRHVGAYRLIGYENRALRTEDFADDAKDAGEIGAGHVVTALYEIVPPGRERDLPGMTPLRYQQVAPAAGRSDEFATVSVRHKQPDGERSRLETHVVRAEPAAADPETAFASAVAEAGLALRRDPLARAASLEQAIRRAERVLGADPGGWRAEFVRLMGLARSLQTLEPAETSQP